MTISEGLNAIIDLNGHNINAGLFAESDGNITEGNTDSYVFWVKKGGKLTIKGNGTVTAATCSYSMAVWAEGGEVIIEGGTFTTQGTSSDLIYASFGGKIKIYGGEFVANPKVAGEAGTNNEYSALNLKDNTLANGDAGKDNEIIVYGGRFYKFNPKDNKSEGPNTNFVAEGYNVTQEGDYYIVVKN